MGNRLSKIYTRTGDDGTTGLGDGTRVGKDDPRIEAFGSIDELNSAIGVVIAHGANDKVTPVLEKIQQELFDLGGELSIPGSTSIAQDAVQRLEDTLDDFNADLPPLKEFIMPGGTPAAAACHVARAACRRAERRVWALAQDQDVNPHSRSYLNRLSDLLFVLARVVARDENGEEILWRGGRQRDP